MASLTRDRWKHRCTHFAENKPSTIRTSCTHTCLLCILCTQSTLCVPPVPLRIRSYSRDFDSACWHVRAIHGARQQARTSVLLDSLSISRYTVHTGSGAHSLRSRYSKERGDDPFVLYSSPTQWRQMTNMFPRRYLVLQDCRHLTRIQLLRRQTRPELFSLVTLQEASDRRRSRLQAFQHDLPLLLDLKLMTNS